MRMWLETSDLSEAPEWRFKLIHVQSGDERYGRFIADFLAFVESHAGVAGPRLTASAKELDQEDA